MQWLEWKMDGDVALLLMNHEQENRFSGPFTKELRKAIAELERDEKVKAVVVTGVHEKYFCNGLDLNWMNQQDEDTLNNFLLDVTQVLKDTALFGKPLIGAINGHTFGLGTIWASGFDFRIMRDDRGWVCFPEMDINIPFLPGMIAICEHGLGTRTYREMAWTAKRFSGPEAVAVGWAREAVPEEMVLPKSIELAGFMAGKAQPAFALTKKRWARQVARIIDELDPEAIKER
jgi:enoyl-CoA hydratase/carnithine racemase